MPPRLASPKFAPNSNGIPPVGAPIEALVCRLGNRRIASENGSAFDPREGQEIAPRIHDSDTFRRRDLPGFRHRGFDRYRGRHICQLLLARE